MTVSAHDYLEDLYRLPELEGWRLLGRHLELTEGFSFVVVLLPDDAGVAYVRSRLPDLVGSPEAVRRVVFDSSAPAERLAEALLEIAPLPKQVRLIWVDADPSDLDGIPDRTEAWRNALSRLNRYRNTLQATLGCTLALAGPISLQTVLREAAPDLWSIRSAVFRIEPAGTARGPVRSNRVLTEEWAGLDGIALGGDPAETLAEAAKITGKPGREILLAQLLRRAGHQAFGMLQWDLALETLQEAYTLEEAHGGDPELRFQIANEIALVFRTLGQWDRALHYSRKALEVAEANYGASDPTTARALNDLASLLHDTNRLADAESFMRRALAIDERSYGADHPKVATDLNNLASLLKDTNRLGEAEPLMRRALAIDERSYGADHPKVATDLNNLASLLHDTNRLGEAEPLMRRALAIDERSYGADHPKVATDLNNLASLLHDTNRLAEAEPLMRRALAIDERSYGADHLKVAIRLNNLASLLEVTNRLAEAEPLYRRSASVLIELGRRNGYVHPHMQSAIDNYVNALRHLGVDEAAVRANLDELGARA